MKIKYKNPGTGKVEMAHKEWVSPVWVFLFGPFYFLFKRNFIHAILSFAVAWFTYGFSILVYPFFTKKINTDFYEQRGWVRIEQEN